MSFLFTLLGVVIFGLLIGWLWPRDPHPGFMPRPNRRFLFGDRKASYIARYIESFVYDARPCWRVDSKVVETMARRWIRMNGYDGYRVERSTYDNRVVYLIHRGQQQIDQIGFPLEWFCDSEELTPQPSEQTAKTVIESINK